jgi:hypothetical protein
VISEQTANAIVWEQQWNAMKQDRDRWMDEATRLKERLTSLERIVCCAYDLVSAKERIR